MSESGASAVVDGKNGDNPAIRIVRAQLIATLVAAPLAWLFDGAIAISVLSGGVVCVLPATWVAWRMNRHTADAGTAAAHMIRAELGKFALTVVLFIAVFVWIEPLEPLFFFGTLIALHGFYIVLPLRDRAKETSTISIASTVEETQR